MFEPLFVRRIAVEKFWRKNFGAENLVFSGDRRNVGTVIYEQFFCEFDSKWIYSVSILFASEFNFA